VHMARDDDTKQKRVCTVHKKSTSIYTPYSLSGESTAFRCGTKPQRLFNEDASHTIECMCVAQSKEMSYIRHTYLVKGKTCVYSLHTC